MAPFTICCVGGDSLTNDRALSEGQSFEEALTRGIEFHNLSVRGEKSATKEAVYWLERAMELSPENPESRAYYGSALALLGRDSVDPQERFAKVLEGLRILDQVVKAHPDQIAIRTVRAYVNYRLPELYFHRSQVAIDDFLFLIDQYNKDTNVFAERFYWQLLYDLGKAYMNIGSKQEAMAVWQELALLGPDETYRRYLRAEGIEVPGDESEPEDIIRREVLRVEARDLLHLGELGDRAVAKKAHGLLTEAHALWPEDAVIEALYGSSLSLMGRYADDGGTMFSQAIQGIEIIERAVQKYPSSIELRWVRANHSFRLPEAFFYRTATAITDFEYLASQYGSGEDNITAEEYREILYRLGECYLRLDMVADARNVWERLLALDPQSPYAAVVTTKLDQAFPKELLATPEVEDLTELIHWGKRFHNQALAEDRAAAHKAREYLQKAHELAPRNSLVEAYYGSAVALTARYSRNSSTMFGDAVMGLMLINSALRRRPKDPQIRLLRGYLCYNLPENLFHLTSTAVEDFEFVKRWYEASRSNKKKAEILSPVEFAKLLRDLQSAYKRLGKEAEAAVMTGEIEALKTR